MRTCSILTVDVNVEVDVFCKSLNKCSTPTSSASVAPMSQLIWINARRSVSSVDGCSKE